MPKGKRKGKFEHRRTEEKIYSSDEDAGIDMTIDNCSETSGQSDLKSTHDETENEQEKLEEKILEMIDALSARSNAARAAAMVSLRNALQRRHFAGVLCNQRATLADHLAKALRRGRDGERRAAAGLAPLLALQIGEEGVEEFVNEVRPELAAAAADKSATLETRTECCSSLAVLCYLLEEDLTEILEVMRMYETIFSGSYLKGDGSVKVSGCLLEAGALHAAALDGWALLLTLLAPEHARALLQTTPPSFHRLADLLQACSLEVRLAAGTALAIAHEHVSSAHDAQDSHHAHAHEPELAALVAGMLPALDRLARDSHKYRAKRDRKLQRATFRDILKYFEDDESPNETVRVGVETVRCEGWRAVSAYTALAGALGAGLQALAPRVEPLRAALRLEAPAPGAVPPAGTRLTRLQRHLQNNAACKARTLARNKNRDKRSAALAL